MNLPGRKVLIVEDEESPAALCEAWLSVEHEVITTHTLDDGIAALDASVDVVVLDRRLPNGAGKHVLDHIQNQVFDGHTSWNRLTAIVGLTAKDKVEPENELDVIPTPLPPMKMT